MSVAYDGNRLILNDLELRQQFPMQVFEFPDDGAQRGLPALRPAANASRVLGNLGDDILSKITLRASGYHCGRRALHGVAIS